MQLVLTLILMTRVEYAFSTKNGNGWVKQEGSVGIELTISDTTGSLHVVGKGRVVDAQLRGGKNLQVTPAEHAIDERFAISDARFDGKLLTFRFDARGDHIEARCQPITLRGVARKSLMECSFTGFRWHEAPALPSLLHPLVFDGPSKRPLKNVLGGSTAKGQGTRRVIAP
jgi:hypothetical protein